MKDRKTTKMLPQAGGPPRRTYQGKRSVKSEVQEGWVTQHPQIVKKLTVKEIRFLDAYHRTASLRKAYLEIYPKANEQSTCRRSSDLIKQIRTKITPDEEWELMGVSLAKIGKTISEGMEAHFVRSFITKDGDIIETQPYIDYAVRQKAVENAMKLRKLDKEEGAGGINVNIVMYADPREPRWPGSEDPAIDITPPEG